MSPISPMRPILPILLLLLSSCSEHDDLPTPVSEPVPTERPISFASSLQEQEVVTRTGLEEVLTDKTFVAFGYKNDAYEGGTYTSYQAVMPGFVVNWLENSAHTTAANTHDWEYLNQGPDQTIKYWDWSALAYRFFGYANGNATASPATEPVPVTVTGGTAANVPNDNAVTFSADVDATSEATIDAAPYFTRLWYSDGNPTHYPDKQFGQAVHLQFLKPFARVRFMFTFIEGLTFDRKDIRNISFHPTEVAGVQPTIAMKGNVSVSYPLKGSETTESWSFTPSTTPSDGLDAFTIDYYETPSPVPTGFPASAAATDWPNTPQKWYIVFPAPNQGSYTLQACVVTDEVRTVVIPAEYMKWKAGYEYTYSFKVTESGGITIDIVQVAISDWSNRRSSDYSVYNW